jgi:hypothetical protein
MELYIHSQYVFMAWYLIKQRTLIFDRYLVGMALGYGLDDRGSRVRFPVGYQGLFPGG